MDRNSSLFCLMLLLVANVTSFETDEFITYTQEFCQWESFNATCKANQFIVITAGRYGRMKVGRCLPIDYYLGCSVDVSRQLETRCSGKSNCTVTVSDRDLFRIQPCRKDLVAYLEASYQCVSVFDIEEDSVKPLNICNGVSLIADRQSGFLSSRLTRQIGIGSYYCPWLIEAHPGQRITITMFDFSIPTDIDSELENLQKESIKINKGYSTCIAMITFYEKFSDPSHQSVQLCKDSERKTRLYTSSTNRLFVELKLNETNDYHYIFHYQVNGCPDVEAPDNAWILRNGDILVVSCNFTSERWHIVCNGQEWVGAFNNCSEAYLQLNKRKEVKETKLISIGLFAAIGIGVILGIIIGFIFLLLLCVCKIRKHHKNNGKETSYNITTNMLPRTELESTRYEPPDDTNYRQKIPIMQYEETNLNSNHFPKNKSKSLRV